MMFRLYLRYSDKIIRLWLIFGFVAFITICWGQEAEKPVIVTENGTDYYLIDSLANLYWIAENTSRWGNNYRQTADIDASETKEWNNGEGWQPIGNSTVTFTGVYDGDGHTISGLYIYRPDSNHQGLFGRIEGAEIVNLGLIDVYIRAGEFVGGLCGTASNGATIKICYVVGLVEGTDKYVGGLAGYIYNSLINNCYSTISVYRERHVGGLIGRNYRGQIVNCYSTGKTIGSTAVGGLVGSIDTGQGYSDVNNFWDIETSGQSFSAGGTGKTTEEMTETDTFIDWDFNEVWDIVDGETYPFLRWQGEAAEHNIPVVRREMVRDGNNYEIRFSGWDWDDEVTISLIDADEAVIDVTFTTYSLHPPVQLFPNPESLGAYYRFDVSDGSVFRNAHELRIPFSAKPNDLWYREGSGSWIKLDEGDWYWDESGKQAVVTELNIGGIRGNDVFEYAGDNGEKGETLPVELTYLGAAVTTEMFVDIYWTTETEINMLGYNVFRNTSNDLEGAVKVNFTIIPAYNTSATRHYSYLDEDVEDENLYYYWVQSNDLDLSSKFYGPVSVLVESRDGDESMINRPFYNDLIGAYPNPFNPGTNIRFSLEEESDVNMKIYDTKGRLVNILIKRDKYPRGEHSIYWNGKNMEGKRVCSGIYIVVIKAGEFRKGVRILMLK